MAGSPLRKNALLCVGISIALFVFDLLLPLGVSGGVPYIVVILLSLKTDNLRYTYSLAGICTGLIIAGFLLSTEGGVLWQVLLNRALAIFAVWVTAVLSIRYRKSRQQLKALRGYLPICAACKKIRDDDGFWNQLETYINERSEATFTHSMCPDCIKSHYPHLHLHEHEQKNQRS